ncbi:c-type cytochrome [Pandoraea commovens]|uniref:Gluconate 2-dehydrogenase cytochrome c subunit n=1 Tax=Pandoraea commovens TaxID=2508289 RepID=A0A5E4XTT6_9BURK|nr:cytochrome c [Pandoraea commovens]VVE39746.1 Gluconate 2-dehydrogenase cytochrome c subunit [Pandoraea commovens]
MKKLWSIALLGLVASVSHAQTPSGKTIFGNNCAACHQAGGQGIPGAFPALKGDKFVLGDAAKVVETVIGGRGGMPTFNSSLNDKQIADVVTFIRAEWGNNAAPVTTEQVASIRKTIAAKENEGGTKGN